MIPSILTRNSPFLDWPRRTCTTWRDHTGNVVRSRVTYVQPSILHHFNRQLRTPSATSHQHIHFRGLDERVLWRMSSNPAPRNGSNHRVLMVVPVVVVPAVIVVPGEGNRSWPCPVESCLLIDCSPCVMIIIMIFCCVHYYCDARCLFYCYIYCCYYCTVCARVDYS